MADISGLASGVISSFFQGIKALKDASDDMNDAPKHLERLKDLKNQLEASIYEAERKYSSKLHNETFSEKLVGLKELVQQFEDQVQKAEHLASRKRVGWIMACCWSATMGEGFLQIAYSMEGQLQTWVQYQGVPKDIDEALERYAQGLPSYLSLQPEDGYQPLHSKVEVICDFLQNSSNKAVLVHGLSGIGKSSLAHYVAASCLPGRFRDGAMKLLLGYGCSRQAVNYNAGEYRKIFATKVVHLLRTQLEYKKYNDLEGISLQQALEILGESLKGKKYLLIIDDVWDSDIMFQLMKLSGNSCKYLVTSRMRSLMDTDVDKVVLTKEDVSAVGIPILQHHCKMMQLPDFADALLKRCGFHPLTVTVMGEALKREKRPEQWAQAIDDLCIYANRAAVPSNYLQEDAMQAATVFGSLEFSLQAMHENTRDLFTTFASLSWVEPIPEPCLEELWRSLRQQTSTTFRLEISSLLKSSLVGKHKSSFSYILHDMVSLYLNDKLTEALRLLKFPDAVAFAVVAPWLFRYGKQEARREADKVILQVLRSDNEMLQAKVFNGIVELCSACRQYQDWSDTCKSFVLLVGPEIPKVLSNILPGGEAAVAVARFIANYYSNSDLEKYIGDLIDSGILRHLQELLIPDHDSLKSIIDVLAKLALYTPLLGIPLQQQVFANMPITKLIALLDPAREVTRNLVGSNVMMAVIRIAKAGGENGVNALFLAGLGEMIVEQIKSDYEEFAGCGMKELNLLKQYYLEGGYEILSKFSDSQLLEGEQYLDFAYRNSIYL